MTDTILIYEKPENYFFRRMSNVYAPYDMRLHSFKYWVYRFLHITGIPLYRKFWGKWKEKIKSSRKVIIFDYGYQRGMDTYIKKINPDCEVFLFYWNVVTKYREGYKSFKNKSHIYSFDVADCEKYNFKYNSSFISRDVLTPEIRENVKRVFFVGGDASGRAEKLLKMKISLEKEGLQPEFRLFTGNTDKAFRDKYESMIIDNYMSYDECITETKKSGIILDIVKEKQKGLTLRFMESVALSKKLITDNNFVKNTDVYRYGNIYVLKNEDYEEVSDELREFLNRPFKAYDKETVEEYFYESWIKRFE